jgi:hypothetical protein
MGNRPRMTHILREFAAFAPERAVWEREIIGLIWSDPVNPAESMGLFLSLSLFLLFPEDRASSSLGRF